MWYIAGGSSVLSKSVPDGFPVVASSTLRPLTCIASGDSLLTWVSVKSQFFSEHAHSGCTCAEAQGGFVFSQVMTDRACRGRDVTGRRTSVGSAWSSTRHVTEAKAGIFS